METRITSYGRMQLARIYFPALCDRAAWRRLKSLLAEHPALQPLATMPRRIFTPAEVEAIFTTIGRP